MSDGDDLLARAQDLQRRSREAKKPINDMENLIKDFPDEFARAAEEIFNMNVQNHEKREEIFKELRAEIERMCAEDDWDTAKDILRRMIKNDENPNGLIEGTEDDVMKGLNERNLEEFSEIMEEAHAMLKQEVRVAKYEKDARLAEVNEEIQKHMIDLQAVRESFYKKPKDSEEQKAEDEESKVAAQ